MDENEDQVDEFVRFWINEGAIAKIRPKVSWAGLVPASNLVILRRKMALLLGHADHAITNDGKVVLCAVDVDASFVAGDINQQSLYEVWNGRLKEIRQLQANGQYNLLPFPCNDCLDWQAARANYNGRKNNDVRYMRFYRVC